MSLKKRVQKIEGKKYNFSRRNLKNTDYSKSTHTEREELEREL